MGPRKYSPFEVPFNSDPLFAPRRLRVVCVGAGFAGLTLAYKVHFERKLDHIVDLQIYERQHDVGGTWLVNKYPGLTCDVPIFIYSLPWCPKHDWRRFMASGPEIRQYIQEVNRKFHLDRWIQFDSAVEEANWNERDGQWELKVRTPGGIIHDRCDFLIGAVGTQNTPSNVAIPGIDEFQGSVVHTGGWDENVDCEGKRVAVIGNGSSGIQVFTALQRTAKQITHYIRSPTWISLNYMSEWTRDGNGRNFDYTADETTSFKDPQTMLAYRKELEHASNHMFKDLVFDDTVPELKREFHSTLESVMRARLNEDAGLIDKLVPKYQPWCRRLTPGDGYLESLQQPNTSLTNEPISRIMANGIQTGTGQVAEYDIIVTATGFDNSRAMPWTMLGRNGVDLADQYSQNTDGYLSVATPSMPNFFTIGCGPNFTIANGSVPSAFGFVADHVLEWIRKVAEEDIGSICVREDVAEAYNIYIQQVFRRTAWNRECNSWYKKGTIDEYRTGITAIYPGSMLHFKSMLDKIRPEDFDIRYRSANRFNFYGCGLTALELRPDEPDLAGYLRDTMKLDNIM